MDSDKVSENETPEPVEEEAVEEEAVKGVAEKASMTSREFTTKFDELFDKARASGRKPIQEMLGSYARRAFSVVDSILDGLSDPKKPKE